MGGGGGVLYLDGESGFLPDVATGVGGRDGGLPAGLFGGRVVCRCVGHAGALVLRPGGIGAGLWKNCRLSGAEESSSRQYFMAFALHGAE